MRLIISFLICCFSVVCSAERQEVRIHIQLCDKDSSEPLPDVVVNTFDTKQRQLSFNITDGDGNTSVSTTGDYLVCSYLGFKELKVKLSTLKENTCNKLYLEKSTVNLKEITVKAPPIREKSDTLVYLVDAFKSQSDRHLEDILKKLPGISVSNDGRISYQGEAISKFYIEGQDLLGGNYNQATANLPVEAVTNVEVLEHNQNVKVLKGKVLEKKAALNIRLNKNYRQRPFGEALLGAGAAPFIWESRLFLTQVGTKGQTMVVAKTNNTGNDYTSDITGQIDITDFGNYDFLPTPFISTTCTATGPVDIDRMTDNESFFAGINHLVKLSENANLRINLLADKNISDFNSLYDYKFGGAYETSYRDISDINDNRYTVKPAVKYELNSDKAFVSDQLTFSLTRNRQNLHLTTEGNYFAQQTKTIPTWIQNKFKSTFSIGGNLFGFNSLTRYYHAGQWLSVDKQSYDYSQLSFVTNNNISTSLTLAGNTVSTGVGINYKINRFNSDSDITYSYVGIYIPLSYNIWYSGTGNISLGCNLYLNRYRLNGCSFTDEKTMVAPLPSISLRQKIIRNLTFSIGSSYSKGDHPSDFYAADSVRRDYRTWYKSLNTLTFTSSYRASLSLDYRNLYHMFFSSFSIIFSHKKDDSYRESNYATGYTLIENRAGRTHRNSLFSNLSADKTFTDASLSIRGELNYSRFTFLLAQNGLLTDNISNTLNTSVKVIYQRLKWINATLGLDYTTSWQNNIAGKSIYLHSCKMKADIKIFPAPKWEIGIAFDNYNNEIQPGKYKSSNFLDGNAIYNISKRISIEAEMKNILNSSAYSYTTDNGLNWTYCRLPLRGREALLKCTLKF